MPRYDNAPVKNTCPIIDSAIGALHNVLCCVNEDDKENLETAIGYSNEAQDLMEEVRSANSTLRDWGNEMCKERDEFENEVDALTRRIAEMEGDYNSEITSLEQQIEDLKQELAENT